jgi:hypothetical protein
LVEETFIRKSWACKLLIALQMFLGVGAVFGGAALIIDPSGDMIGMPAAMLVKSPFTDFFIPGIILLLVLGICPLIAAYGLITKREWAAVPFNLFATKHWSWTYSLYTGFALIIWITVEAYMINAFGFVHVLYMAVGLGIQAAAMLPSVQEHYDVRRRGI